MQRPRFVRDDSDVISHPKHFEAKTGDYSGLAILLSNAFTIGLAIFQNWDLRPLLMIYWAQSAIIGVFSFFRMVLLKKFSTEGLKSNGKAVPETSKGKWSTAIFFAVHYGFFHVVYAVFVFGAVFGGSLDKKFGGAWVPGNLDWLWIALAVAVFAQAMHEGRPFEVRCT